MTLVRRAAWVLLISIIGAALAADWLAPASYSAQFRESPNAPPGTRFPLGTDELGRDRLSRLLYGTRVSLLLAPAAALLSTLLAALIGGTAGYFGGWWERLTMSATDLALSLPWLFLLLAARAVLPLNTSPITSVAITFLLLGLLGWPLSARVVRAAARSLKDSDHIACFRAFGCGGIRMFWVQALPNLRPVFAAQFGIAIPTFILSEANLGLLGLGVSEPLPSLGSLLRELENPSLLLSSFWAGAPVAVLVLVVSCFHLIVPREDYLQ